MKSTCKWKEKYQSVVDNGRGLTYNLDMPPAKGGDDTAPTALEMAVMSLSGCIVTIFAVVASKMRIAFSELEVELTADKTDNDPTVTAVHFEVKIKTDVSREKIEKCLEHTMSTCPVGVLFRNAGITLSNKITML
jgi:putative redox protein